MSTVLVGVDGSAPSLAAARWAADEAALRGADLTVCCVGAEYAAGEPTLWGSSQVVRERAEDVAEHAAAVARAEHVGLAVHVAVAVGRAARVLAAASRDADLLVVGHRGLGAFLELLLGSVGEHLVRHAACPVVVVRGDPAGWVGPVVVGIDGAPESAAAVEYAVSAAARRHVPLCALTAAPPVWTAPEAPIGATTPGVGALLGRMQEEALAPALKRHPDVPVEHRTVLAGAARALVDAGVGSGLLVLGTGGPAVLGSVGGHVLRHASCPVAVVPADWAPDRPAG